MERHAEVSRLWFILILMAAFIGGGLAAFFAMWLVLMFMWWPRY